MKSIKYLCLTIILLALAVPASAETRGWGAGLAVRDGEFGVQARKDFWLGGDVSQITGQGSVYFASDAIFALDVDYHFIVNSENPSRFYPLAGIDFAFTSDHAKFGLNAGGGATFMLTEKTAAFAEVKYVISDWDGFAFALGIYF